MKTSMRPSIAGIAVGSFIVGAAIGLIYFVVRGKTNHRANDRDTFARSLDGSGKPLIAAYKDDSLEESQAASNLRETNDWVSRILVASADSLPGLLSEINELEHDKKGPLRGLLFNRWVRLAPHAALQWIEGASHIAVKENYFHQLFSSWTRHDEEAALKWARGISNRAAQQRALLDVVSSKSETDPPGALELYLTEPALAGSPSGNFLYSPTSVWGNPDPLGSIFSNWAKSDPLAAAKAISKLTSLSDINDAVRNLGRAWAKQDPDQALQWAESLESPANREMILRAALVQWGIDDPEKAHAYVAHLPAGPSTNRIVEDLVKRERDPNQAIALAKKLNTSALRGDALSYAANSMIYSGVAGEDLQRLIAEIPDFAERSRLIASFTRKDPEVAMSIASSLTDPDQRDKAVSKTVWSAAESHPRKAVELVNALSEGDIPSSHVSYVAEKFARLDTDAAITWSNGLPGEFGQQARVGAMETWWKMDPDAAEQFALDEDSQSNQADYLAGITVARSEQDPDAAAAWLYDLPGEPKQELYEQVFQEWSKLDVYGLSEWAGDAENGNVRDAAVLRILEKIGAKDVEAARAWVDSISDPQLRQQFEGKF